MKVLYIGQHTEGTTSKMRADKIAEIFGDSSFSIIDTHIPFYITNRIFRSIGVRFKKGNLVTNINKYILKNLGHDYDLIWVDKGVYITKKTLNILKGRTNKILHFTPDMAFFHNKSSNFINNMNLYDFVITTKSPEVEMYNEHINENKIILVSQGYDSTIHKPHVKFEEKENFISFVGLYEKHRGTIIQALIDEKIHVHIAGKRWKSFVKKNNNNPYLTFTGNGVFSMDYSNFISKSRMSLGLMSKNFFELHTTRTFEIPACGTAILTERNIETSRFFKEDEAIFFDDKEDLVKKVKYYLSNLDELKVLSEKGCNSVKLNSCDYKSIILSILRKTDLV